MTIILLALAGVALFHLAGGAPLAIVTVVAGLVAAATRAAADRGAYAVYALRDEERSADPWDAPDARTLRTIARSQRAALRRTELAALFPRFS